MLFSVRDIDVLRLLCWCQNIDPGDLNSISTTTERENLIALGFIKEHEKSNTLTISESGKALLRVIFEGNIQNLTFSYHESVIVRRIRLSKHLNKSIRFQDLHCQPIRRANLHSIQVGAYQDSFFPHLIADFRILTNDFIKITRHYFFTHSYTSQ